MTYNGTYNADDLAPIVIDGLSAFLVVGVTFATLIGLVVLIVIARKQMKKR